MAKLKVRALLIHNIDNEQYRLQVQHRFLFFKWWETIRKGENGKWQYGNAIYSKEVVEGIRRFCESNEDYEFSYKTIAPFDTMEMIKEFFERVFISLCCILPLTFLFSALNFERTQVLIASTCVAILTNTLYDIDNWKSCRD